MIGWPKLCGVFPLPDHRPLKITPQAPKIASASRGPIIRRGDWGNSGSSMEFCTDIGSLDCSGPQLTVQGM